MIDLYCARLAPGLLAEPLNAMTNLAFLIAAWFSWQVVKEENKDCLMTRLMVLLIAVIGVGSGLFHTFANGWSQLADVIPIMVFQLLFLALYCRRVLTLSWLITGVSLLSFVAAAVLMGQFKHLLNGSVVYLPAFAVLVILGLQHYRLGLKSRGVLVWASLVFLMSLSFRSLDLWLCPSWPIGTHFLWHLSNSLLLYLLIKGLVQNYKLSA